MIMFNRALEIICPEIYMYEELFLRILIENSKLISNPVSAMCTQTSDSYTCTHTCINTYTYIYIHTNICI
jgi:hypothetical protein